MAIEEVETKRCYILKVAGAIDSHSAHYLESKLDGIIENDERHIVIDMTNVVFLSSHGLKLLLQTHRRLDAHNRHLVLTNIPNDVLYALNLTGFDKVLVIKETALEAVGSF